MLQVLLAIFLAAPAHAAFTVTTRMGLLEPVISTRDVWGSTVNKTFDIIDASTTILGGTQTLSGLNTFSGYTIWRGSMSPVMVSTNAALYDINAAHGINISGAYHVDSATGATVSCSGATPVLGTATWVGGILMSGTCGAGGGGGGGGDVFLASTQTFSGSNGFFNPVTIQATTTIKAVGGKVNSTDTNALVILKSTSSNVGVNITESANGYNYLELSNPAGGGLLTLDTEGDSSLPTGLTVGANLHTVGTSTLDGAVKAGTTTATYEINSLRINGSAYYVNTAAGGSMACGAEQASLGHTTSGGIFLSGTCTSVPTLAGTQTFSGANTFTSLLTATTAQFGLGTSISTFTAMGDLQMVSGSTITSPSSITLSTSVAAALTGNQALSLRSDGLYYNFDPDSIGAGMRTQTTFGGGFAVYSDSYVFSGLTNFTGENGFFVIPNRQGAIRYGDPSSTSWDAANNGNNSLAGGTGSSAAGTSSFAVGSAANASGDQAAVLGGVTSTASGTNSTVIGGRQNTASATNSAVVGGSSVTATGGWSIALGGDKNSAKGFASASLGGQNNLAFGSWSLAAGQRAKSTAQGAFTWADSQAADLSNATTDQFQVRAQGGFYVDSSSISFRTATSTLAYADAQGVTFPSCISVYMVNGADVTVSSGMVVRASTSAASKFDLTAASDDMPIGTVLDTSCANGATCRIGMAGICPVLMAAGQTCTIGYIIVTSSTDEGRAECAATVPVAATHFKEIGHATTNATSGSTLSAVLHFN